ncbi:MAG: hypothetical protein OSB43_06590 [Nocardioides sp.]|uniref:hypothetical protein n=1 Tax=Nocardioides sp. TaxID=35761 RepID=UPI00238C2DCF|nr:hypothetical protein [Nocardioides sp.]MDE0775920.1 hypothetical protein [Nocardioides sp.]
MPLTDASDLLRTYEPNCRLFEDADDGPAGWAHHAFHAALGGAVPSELLQGNPSTPLLRWPNQDAPAMPLLGAMLSPPNHRASKCNRCSGKLYPKTLHRLWVPGGQSAVELQVCGFCYDVLNDVYRTGDDDALLVWR